jgi:hypothetical protein
MTIWLVWIVDHWDGGTELVKAFNYKADAEKWVKTQPKYNYSYYSIRGMELEG